MDFRYLLNKNLSSIMAALPEDFNVLAMALESTNSGVVITDYRQLDNPIIYCNHAFENMTGYNREEVIGLNCRFLQGSDLGQDALLELNESVMKGIPVTVVLRNYQKGGKMFWNELSLAPVRDHEGVVTHFIGIQTDITCKRTMETDLMEQIDLLNDRLEKQNKYIKKVEEILFGIMQASQECLVVLDENFVVVKANSNFYHVFQQTENQVIGQPFEAIQNGQWNDRLLHTLLSDTLSDDKPFDDFPLHPAMPNDNCKEIIVNGRKLKLAGMAKDFILLTIRRELALDEYTGMMQT
jgi:two-component system phosphate regulon sensor histidine kinase PhoR